MTVKAIPTLIVVLLLVCVLVLPASVAVAAGAAAAVTAATEGDFSASPDGRLRRFVNGQWIDCPIGSQIEAANGARFLVDGPLTSIEASELTEVFARLAAQNPHGPVKDTDGNVIHPAGLTTSQLVHYPAFPGTHGMPDAHGVYYDGSGPPPSYAALWVLVGGGVLLVVVLVRFTRRRALPTNI